mgnify:CR=1 FL=1
MTQFKKGDQVESIDDDLIGIVKNINAQDITVEDQNGFIFEMHHSKLIKSPEDQALSKDVFQTNSIRKIINEKEQILTKTNSNNKSKKSRSASAFQVDLHIHQLIDSTKGMNNFEMLNLQLSTAKKQLDFAIKKRMPKIVFIHGVGEGVLKMELHTLLRRYDHIEFYDADFKTYGFGATEVRIYNSK